MPIDAAGHLTDQSWRTLSGSAVRASREGPDRAAVRTAGPCDDRDGSRPDLPLIPRRVRDGKPSGGPGRQKSAASRGPHRVRRAEGPVSAWIARTRPSGLCPWRGSGRTAAVGRSPASGNEGFNGRGPFDGRDRRQRGPASRWSTRRALPSEGEDRRSRPVGGRGRDAGASALVRPGPARARPDRRRHRPARRAAHPNLRRPGGPPTRISPAPASTALAGRVPCPGVRRWAGRSWTTKAS